MKDMLRPGSWLTTLAAIAVMGSNADAQTYPVDLYENLQWENIGPARGGRSTAVAGSEARPLESYFGVAGGGLGQTSDPRTSGSPVTDHPTGSPALGTRPVPGASVAADGHQCASNWARRALMAACTTLASASN